MRRGYLLFVGLCLLGSVAGCSRGVCDCYVHPIGHGTPSPIIRPASATAEQCHEPPTPAQVNEMPTPAPTK